MLAQPPRAGAAVSRCRAGAAAALGMLATAAAAEPRCVVTERSESRMSTSEVDAPNRWRLETPGHAGWPRTVRPGDAQRAKILGLNGARLFGFEVPKGYPFAL
jgi:hypothetical protein